MAESIKKGLAALNGWGKVIAIVFACGMAYNKLDNVADDVATLTVARETDAARLTSLSNRVAFLEGRANASDKRESPPFVPDHVGPR